MRPEPHNLKKNLQGDSGGEEPEIESDSSSSSEEEDHDGEEAEEPEPAPTVQVNQLRIFKDLSVMINTLQSQHPEQALRLNLQACQAINNLSEVSALED